MFQISYSSPSSNRNCVLHHRPQAKLPGYNFYIFYDRYTPMSDNAKLNSFENQQNALNVFLFEKMMNSVCVDCIINRSRIIKRLQRPTGLSGCATRLLGLRSLVRVFSTPFFFLFASQVSVGPLQIGLVLLPGLVWSEEVRPRNKYLVYYISFNQNSF